MGRLTIIISIIILILLAIALIFMINQTITGEVIGESRDSLENYTYTKAICDENNYCQDNVITCQGEEIISVTPITGAAVQFHPTDFKDPRNQEVIDKMC
jgi:hypothetical protein